MKQIYILLACILLTSVSYAQITPILLEAEDASLIGSDFNVITEGDTTYVTPSTDRADGDGPMQSEKLLTFNVPFAAAGDYHLYIKLRVGPAGPNDDSFWLANSLGEKDPEEPTDWILVNNISNGAAYPDSIVTNAATGIGNNIFKWVNASLIGGGDSQVETKFEVSSAGSMIYVYGSREDALDIDKIAFAEAGKLYTVAELEAGTSASGPSITFSTESETNAIRLYPNPAGEVINIQLNIQHTSDALINIYGSTGSLMKSVIMKEQSLSLNVDDLSSGIYIINTICNGKNYSQKFIID
ncbi:MAG: T9SS type A sorting domain-containing protein [Bacteroidales bacterium]|nr:T9SS type A sorting domain-containing protein [Bacteroidales bacterium]MBN2820391.1 T9SS type A sorting domain-containing protein [Bacteroidales bacterium]